jgi:hypothetical protein
MTPWIARGWLAAVAGCPEYELEVAGERVGEDEIEARYARGGLPVAALHATMLDRGPGRRRTWMIEAKLADGRTFVVDVDADRRILL